jgi:C-terminal processing protease CtpA/Prc
VIARLAFALGAFAFAVAAAAAWPELDARQRGEDFDAASRAIEQRYAYPEALGTRWRRVREAWRPRAIRAASREQFVAALEGALAELHDDHVSLSERSAASPRRIPSETDIWARWVDGAAIVEAVRTYGDADVAGLRPGSRITRIAGMPVDRAVGERLGRLAARGLEDRNWALRQLLAGERGTTLRVEVEERGSRTFEIERSAAPPANGAPILMRRMGEGRDLGYIRIKHALAGPRLEEHVDAALGELRDTRALILDLREASNGGSRAATLAILGRFVTTPTAWQRRHPRGSVMVTDTVAPRGPFAYRAPLVVLVDRWTAGEGEALAAGLAAAANARLVGTRMAGLRGELGEVRLPHGDITLRLPVARVFHLDGTPREALRPHVEIDLAAPSGGPGDPILYQALKLLEPSSAPARRSAPR